MLYLSYLLVISSYFVTQIFPSDIYLQKFTEKFMKTKTLYLKDF